MGKSRNREEDFVDKEISEDKLSNREAKKNRVKNRRKQLNIAIEESILLGIELDSLYEN